MKILDTNLWVFGMLGTHDVAEQYLTSIETGETTAAINAYMVQEAMGAFDRVAGFSSPQRDKAKTLFLRRLTQMDGLLEMPTSQDHVDDLLAERRAASHTKLIGRVLDIQPKDVPILLLAFEHEDRNPTILTNDEAFASLTPSDHGLGAISIEHVE